MDNKELFEKYIFGWMCRDIEREIELAKKRRMMGEMRLSALGLLAYTEFMGIIIAQISFYPCKRVYGYFNAYLRLGSTLTLPSENM